MCLDEPGSRCDPLLLAGSARLRRSPWWLLCRSASWHLSASARRHCCSIFCKLSGWSRDASGGLFSGRWFLPEQVAYIYIYNRIIKVKNRVQNCIICFNERGSPTIHIQVNKNILYGLYNVKD